MERPAVLLSFLMLMIGAIHAQDANRCCTPAQYQTKVGISVRTGRRHRSLTDDNDDEEIEQKIYAPRFAMDFTDKRLAMEEVSLGKRPMNVTTIVDYNSGNAFVILNGGVKCFKVPVKAPMESRCLDDWPKAKNRGTVTVGSGTNSLKVDNWMVSAKVNTSRGPVSMDVYAMMTTGDCIPVSEEIRSKSRDSRSTMDLLFWDLVTRIPDPSIFDVPAVCKKAMELNPDDIPGLGPSLMGRYSAK